jgi:putative dehydrogenase
MGGRMCRNLLKAGHKLAVHDAMPAACEAFSNDEMAQICRSPGELGDLCDVIVLMVHNDRQCEAVVFGQEGLAQTLRPGAVLVAMSTLPPDYVFGLQARLDAKQVVVLDAPVSGGIEGAENASLTIMAAGSDLAFSRAESVLSSMGKLVVRVGNTPGQGQTTKVLNQLMYFTGIAIAAEAVVAASKAGIKPDSFIEAVSNGSGDNWALRNRIPLAWKNDYRSGGALDIAPKDLGAALSMCRKLGVYTPCGAAASQAFLAATRLCREDADDSEYVRFVESLSGHELSPGD